MTRSKLEFSESLSYGLAPPPDRHALLSRAGWIALALALLLHFVLLGVLPHFFPNLLEALKQTQLEPVRTPVETVSAEQLEQMRNRIKKQKLLLDSDPNRTPEPEDARYKDIGTLSSRNRRVEKETRAQDAQSTVPRPRSGVGTDLSELGVAIPGVNQKPEEAARSNSRDGVRQRSKNAPKSKRQQSAGNSGSEQLILDDQLATGAENVLNTRSSQFYSFYARIHQAIGPLWESQAREVTRNTPLTPADYITQVEVQLDRDGRLVQVHVHRSAGVEAFDRAVIQSWKKVARFPNPPVALVDADGKLRMGWTFTFRLQKGAVEILAPQRRF